MLPLSIAANALTAHPDGMHVIVGGAVKDKAFAATVELLGDGAMRQSALSAVAQPGGYLNVDHSGRFFLFSHYRSGAIGSYALDEAAVVGDAAMVTKTPNLEAHCIVPTPDNRFVHIPCGKMNNAIFQYAFDERAGQLTPLVPFKISPPTMFGPRHVVYHPTFPIAYFSNEQQLGASVYQIAEDGQLSDLQHATTVPCYTPYQKGQRDLSASNIVISPDASRLFVTLRDFTGEADSVSTFRVEADGRLSLLHRSKVGDLPVRLAMSPEGEHVLISEMGESRLSAYRVQLDGALVRVASVELPGSSRDMVVIAD